MNTIIHHTFSPIYNEASQILILGSFPSVKSRENGFYYGHPNNRFWKVIAGLFEYPLPQSIEEKKTMLLELKIALWDVVESCEIKGSDDSSIQNVKVNDLDRLMKGSEIKHIFANGKKAYELLVKYGQHYEGIPVTVLPSTSPANAAYNLEKLKTSWKIVREVE